jgi:hypothetical protein
MVEDVFWDPHLVLTPGEEENDDKSTCIAGLQQVEILGPEDPVRLLRPEASGRIGSQEAVIRGGGNQEAVGRGIGNQEAVGRGGGNQEAVGRGGGNQEAVGRGGGHQEAVGRGGGNQEAVGRGRGNQEAGGRGGGNQEAVGRGGGNQEAVGRGGGNQEAVGRGGNQEAVVRGAMSQYATTKKAMEATWNGDASETSEEKTHQGFTPYPPEIKASGKLCKIEQSLNNCFISSRLRTVGTVLFAQNSMVYSLPGENDSLYKINMKYPQVPYR